MDLSIIASGDLFERGEELARKIRKRKLGKVQSATKPACAKHQVQVRFGLMSVCVCIYVH